MPLHLKLFYFGLLVYAASFFLLATGSFPLGDGRMLGFLCAFYAFALPLELGTKALFHNVPMPIDAIPYLSLLIAGWINPVFVAAAFLSLTRIHEKLVAVLKSAVLIMILFTLLFFATFILVKDISLGLLVCSSFYSPIGLRIVRTFGPQIDPAKLRADDHLAWRRRIFDPHGRIDRCCDSMDGYCEGIHTSRNA